MIDEARNKEQNSTFCVVNGHISSQEFGVGTKTSQNTKAEWCSEVTVKDRFICITNDGCKRNGCQSKATRMRRTNSGCSISLHPGQNGRCPDIIVLPNAECPDIWIRLPSHNWPKSCLTTEEPVVPLERNLYGHPLTGLLWEKLFEKVPLEHGWASVPKLGMFLS